MQPGDSLDGRYTIVSRLGAGGMGEVYKATHNFLSATRVIKIIHPTISKRQDAHERFLREARIATKVQHPNVATLHDFASLPDGSHYMVWEYIDGENLAQRLLARGLMPPRQAVRIALQALHGLEAIHAAGIIHRDISPENLMITAGDTVKIIDLGVAKIDDPDAVSQTRTGIFVGKLRYAAPEQLGFLPENERIDGRTDLYALAMVLVELLTGRPPYEAKAPHEYFLHHAREMQRTTVELPAQLPGSSALRAVLEKALERDRNLRYANAREFAAALEEIEKTLPAAVETPTIAVPLDGDETMKLRATAAGTTAPEAIPVPPPPAAATAAGHTIASAAPTIQTPFPGAPPIPPARTRSGIKPIYLVLAVLLLFGAAAGAVALIKPVQLIKRITGANPAAPPETTATVAEAKPVPAQTTIDATPAPVITGTTAPSATIPAQDVPSTVTSAPRIVREEPRPPIAPRRTDEQPQQQVTETAEEPLQSRVRAVAVYVDGPGSVGANDRALQRLRGELRGTRRVALHAGALQVPVYRAIHRYLPDLEFDEESDVVITFDSTPRRLSLDRHDLSARVTIEKQGRVIFRYELPRHYDRSQAPDAFARTLAEAFSE
jgi:tRNA A-37 threonylcarbamoyl transferase component Bud32